MTKLIQDTRVYSAALGAFLFRSDKALTFPNAVFIEPTNICNLKCPLCASGSGIMGRPKGRMSLAAFKRIIDSLPKSVTTLYLWGQGEPFMVGDFISMLHYASARNFTTVTSTNGHFLDDPSAIVKSGLNELIVSLDGVTAEQYEGYRKGGDFNKVISSIRALAAEKKKTNTGPALNLQFLVTKDTVGDIPAFVALAENLGVDKHVVKTIQAVSLDNGASYLPENLELSRYKRALDGSLVPDRYRYLEKRCMRIYYSCQIDWQGNMLPCCFDKDSEYIMGNVFNETFEECWNSEEFRSYRGMFLKNGRVLPMCLDCTEGLKRTTIKG